MLMHVVLCCRHVLTFSLGHLPESLWHGCLAICPPFAEAERLQRSGVRAREVESRSPHTPTNHHTTAFHTTHILVPLDDNIVIVLHMSLALVWRPFVLETWGVASLRLVAGGALSACPPRRTQTR